MNIKQQAHTKMLVAVLGVLDSFKTIWQAVVAFASAHEAGFAENSPAIHGWEQRNPNLKSRQGRQTIFFRP